MFASSPEGIAYEKHYFSYITPQGERDSETIENLIAIAEEEYSKVLKKILLKEGLSDDEFVTFASFIASMTVRTPNFRNNIQESTAAILKHMSKFMASHKENFESMLRRYEQETGEKIEMSVEELRQWTLNTDNYTVRVDAQYAIGMALSLMERLTEIFAAMSWTFMEAGGEFNFMTGDNPLSYIDPSHPAQSPYGVGLQNKGIEVTLPLSKNICAFGSWKPNKKYYQASTEFVRQMNRRTVKESGRFIFTDKKSQDIDKFVKKYKNTHSIMKVHSIGDFVVTQRKVQ